MIHLRRQDCFLKEPGRTSGDTEKTFPRGSRTQQIKHQDAQCESAPSEQKRTECRCDDDNGREGGDELTKGLQISTGLTKRQKSGTSKRQGGNNAPLRLVLSAQMKRAALKQNSFVLPPPSQDVLQLQTTTDQAAACSTSAASPSGRSSSSTNAIGALSPSRKPHFRMRR